MVRTRYAPDRGLQARMGLTMFLLGLVFVALVIALVFVLAAFKQGAGVIIFFAVKLHWLPAISYVPFNQSPVEWFRHLILVWMAVGIPGAASFALRGPRWRFPIIRSWTQPSRSTASARPRA